MQRNNKTRIYIIYGNNFRFSSSSSSLPGPEAYALAAPQPAGLLCNADLDVPALTTSLLYEILAGQRWNYIQT
jgi:hypothetical protein